MRVPFTQVPNTLLERMAKMNLTAYESRIMAAAIREMMGWHKESGPLSVGLLHRATGINRGSISRVRAKLVKKGLLTVDGTNYGVAAMSNAQPVADKSNPPVAKLGNAPPVAPEQPFKERTTTTKKTITTVAPLALPDWLSQEIWDSYLEHRKAKRAKLTPHAVQLCIRHLTEWHSQGQDVKAIIEQSIANGWTGLFPLKSNGNGHRQKPEGFIDRKLRELRESDAKGNPPPPVEPETDISF